MSRPSIATPNNWLAESIRTEWNKGVNQKPTMATITIDKDHFYRLQEYIDLILSDFTEDDDGVTCDKPEQVHESLEEFKAQLKDICQQNNVAGHDVESDDD